MFEMWDHEWGIGEEEAEAVRNDPPYIVDGIGYKYKPGDLVRVRSDLAVDCYYGSPYNDDSSVWQDTLEEKFAGRDVVIVSCCGGWYDIAEDDEFCWNDDMFEGLVEEIEGCGSVSDIDPIALMDLIGG